MIKKLADLILLFLLVAGSVQAQSPKELKERWNQMHKSKEIALKEFNEAKFGLFIHWGLYSRLAGEWKGQKITIQWQNI
jgi:alpha-L-fucosidase